MGVFGGFWYPYNAVDVGRHAGAAAQLVEEVLVSRIRQAARGQPCQIRLPGICNRNPETVVLAHYRMGGTCGTGLKPPDWQAAFACSACHDEADRRTQYMDENEVRLAHAEGVMRTIDKLIQKGLIEIKE